MKDVIFSRKSCRSFSSVSLDDTILTDSLQGLIPLFSEIKTEFRILKKSEVRSLCPWIPPQLIAAYSEVKDGYLENIGFLLQQVDLRLQQQGIGVCWIGLGKPTVSTPEGMEFVILLAVGTPNGDIKRSAEEFLRKPMCEITDVADARLEPARVAPSAVNSQPWYFLHEGDTIHVYRFSHGLRKALTLGRMNQIDMGIALCHLFVSNPNTFRFFSADAPEKKGYVYTGSNTL